MNKDTLFVGQVVALTDEVIKLLKRNYVLSGGELDIDMKSFRGIVIDITYEQNGSVFDCVIEWIKRDDKIERDIADKLCGRFAGGNLDTEVTTIDNNAILLVLI